MTWLGGLTLWLLGILVEWAWSTYFSFFGAAPQVLLLLTVVLASRAGPGASLSFAFGSGLFLDVLAAHLFGAHALVLTVTAYAVGMARRQMDITSPVSQVALGWIVSWAYFSLLALVGLAFEGQAFWVGWKAFWLAPILNGLAAPLVFSLVASRTR